jgi:hypothetical protein
MVLRFALWASLIVAVVAGGSFTVSAAPIGSQANALGAAASQSSLVETVQWGYCHRVRQTCAVAFGWRTGRYFRCVARRGCW